jgi:hypothetical protein
LNNQQHAYEDRKQAYRPERKATVYWDKESQQPPHHTHKYRPKNTKNKVKIKNDFQVQWQPTTIAKNLPISMIQQLLTGKKKTTTQYSPP